MTDRLLRVSVDQGVALLALCRPEARNALNLELVEALGRALDELAARPELRALILHGEGGKAFAAGADIGDLYARGSREALLSINARLFQRVEEFPLPTIAAIRGHALGGGLELALACDIRIAADDAKLGLPEVTLGIFPAAGGTRRLPRLVGDGFARELVFTGRLLGALEAERIGLVNRVVPVDRLLDEAMGLAREIAQNDELALRMAKLALLATAHGKDSDAFEKAGQALLFDSKGKEARMRAFLERKAKSKERGGKPA
ncbi:MAG: enoyl-CoA hydratase/isomerase family protein [Deltaproteobacteria bacterium]